VFCAAVPPYAAHVSASAAVVRPLKVAPAFRAAEGSTATQTAELTLSHARIPAGGGSFQFYLLDLKAPANPVLIGKLAIEGPAAPEVHDLRVHVELPPSALALLRASTAPAIKIVARRGRAEPLMAQSVELHNAR